MANSPDLTKFKFFKTIEDDATNLLQHEINQGWALIVAGVKRNTADYDGEAFRDEFIYVLGRNDPPQ